MKKLAVLFALIFLAAGRVSAQVKVEVVFESEQYLPNEALVARVRIENSSGSTLRLGEAPDWLSFVIETTDGPFVRQLRSPEVVGAFDLESSHTATKKVDLAPCFDLSKAGRYRVVATVKVPAFNTSFASAGKSFFISGGSKLWDKVFGVPTTIAPAGPDGQPELRKYFLVQANSAAETKLYVRVTDVHENNLRVVPIGPLISFSRPEPQVDKWSNLHVLYQSGAVRFLYCVVNPEGFIIARETHEYTDTRPVLGTNDEGRISVRGGARRLTLSDLPPADSAMLPTDQPEAAIPAALPAAAASTPKSDKKATSPVNAKEKKKR